MISSLKALAATIVVLGAFSLNVAGTAHAVIQKPKNCAIAGRTCCTTHAYWCPPPKLPLR